MEPRFRTKRCTHGLAIGLCEMTGCEGAVKAKARDAAVTRLEAHCCSNCKQRRGDAVLRDISTTEPRHARLCDECFAGRVVRDAAAAEGKKVVTSWWNGKARRTASAR